MKNPLVIFVILAVIVVLGIGAYTLSPNNSQSDSMMKKDEAMMPKKDTSTEPANAMMQKKDNTAEVDKMTDDKMANSRYTEYSKAAFDTASNTRRVLFFYASWCPTCKPADENFRKNVNKIPEDITLIRVNYNDPETNQEEKDLARKYGITYQHTFVQIDNTGKEVTTWNGGQIDELLSNSK